jgi:hypothetical protein
MFADEGNQTVDEEEYIYRRIPVSQGWYNPDTSLLSPEAFNPIKNDTTGLSVSRAILTTIDKAAQGKSRKGYYIAVLRVSDLRSKGIDVVPKPIENDPSHAEIPGLIYGDWNTDQVKEWKLLLAHELTLRVEGPFHTSSI